jgi:hypothetical protein
MAAEKAFESTPDAAPGQLRDSAHVMQRGQMKVLRELL